MNNLESEVSTFDLTENVSSESLGRFLHLALLKRETRKNYDFSKRGLAHELGVSRHYLTEIFQGTSKPSPELLQKIVKALEFGSFDEFASEYKASKTSAITAKESKAHFVNFYDSSDFSLHDQWYYIAILDLTTCSNFEPDSQWIAERLGISREETIDAISGLQKKGLLKFENGTWKKTENHLFIPTISSREKIRRYHKAMSLKAIEVMENNTSTESFQKRLIKGSTFAANPQHLEAAKNIINRALAEVIEIMTEGECTELYHCNLQLFPLLTQKEEVK